MSAPAPLVVLDASAALAWVLNERNAEVIDKVLHVSVLPASAMVEVLYRAVERGHRLAPVELHEALIKMGVRVEPVTDDDTVRAGDLIAWSRTKDNDQMARSLSLGDGLCIAVAERLGLVVTGGDQYWESVPTTAKYRPFR